MAAQKNIAQFLNNTENAQRLNGLVDDIREAVMDYQVCTSKDLAFPAPNIFRRLPYSVIHTTTPVAWL